MSIQINGQTDTISAVDNNFSLAGNVSIGGTLTYEDVTSVDAVGLSTFQAGIHIDDSITHLGDTDTKIRFPANDTITAETAGSERLRIHGDGEVEIKPAGVGQTTLSVEANYASSGNVNIQTWSRFGAAVKIAVKYVDSETMMKFGTITNHNLAFLTGDTERLRITSAGLVGIGTDNPTAKLHVVGGATIDGLIVTGIATIGDVNVIGSPGQNNTVFGKSSLEDVTTGSHNAVFGFFAGKEITSGSDNTACGNNALRDNTTGDSNIAVGKNALLFNDNADGNTGVGDNALNRNESGSNNTAIGLKAGYYIEGSNNTILGAYQGVVDDSSLNGTVIISAGTTERLRITSNGDVGIGTAIPITAANYTSLSLANTSGAQIELKRTGNNSTHYIWTDGTDSLNIGANYNGDGTSGESGDLIFRVNGNNERLRINNSGYMTTAPSGMMIRSGFYDTGTGSGARTAISATSWATININGTNQKLHNLTKFSTDGLAYNKVSGNSHLNVTINFPYYYDDSSGTANGFGIRCLFSIDDGSNYYYLSGLSEGPSHGWGAGGYGGAASGIFTYTWNTRMNPTLPSSTVLAKTGNVRFYWQVRTWSGTSTIHMIDYLNSTYPKKGSVIIQEIVE